MTFAEYLATSKTTILAFAKKAGLHPATLHRFLNGDFKPQGGTIEKIVAASDGKLTPNDLIATKGAKKARKRAA